MLDSEFLRLSVQAVTPNLSQCETIEEGGYVSIYNLSKQLQTGDLSVEQRGEKD